MHVLIINRFFGGQQTPTGRMARDVAVELQRRGHEVSVLASKSNYAGSAGESLDADKGFKVKRVGELGGGRLMRWGSFWMRSLLALCSRRWERCLLLTDPPFLPFAAWLTRGSRARRQQVYWWTMDLYPEALVAARMITERGYCNRLLRFLNELGLREVNGVIALGPRQTQRLQTYRHWKVSPAFSEVVSPWDYRPLPAVEVSANSVLNRLGCSGKKVALYTGNLGEGHPFTPFVEAARWFHQQGRTDWRFVFAVRGAGRIELEAQASGLSNFQIVDYLPESETASLLWLAKVHLVSMKAGWEGVIVPSKLCGALQTKAPILFLGPLDADTAIELARTRRGLSLSPTATGENVARTLEKLEKNTLACEQYVDTGAPQRLAEFITR